MNVRLKLGDINGYQDGLYCVPTMLCAISGLTPTEIGLVLRDAAAEFGVQVSPQPQRSYNINHWLRAIKRLGGNYREIQSFDELSYFNQFTIDQILPHLRDDRLYLVFGIDEAETETHVFATCAGEVVDTYTGGKKVKVEPVPLDYLVFKVKRIFVVWNV
jgi:hypothetical protein